MRGKMMVERTTQLPYIKKFKQTLIENAYSLSLYKETAEQTLEELPILGGRDLVKCNSYTWFLNFLYDFLEYAR